MKDTRITRLAEMLLSYSVPLKAGECIMIESRGVYSLELAKELIRLSTQRGAVPFWYYNDDSLERLWLRDTSPEQMASFTELHLDIIKQMDAYIAIRGSDNVFDKADVPHDNLKLHSEVFVSQVVRYRADNTKWVVLRWPNNAMAQLAEMSQEAFEDYYFRVCTLDYARLSQAMDPLKELMEKTRRVAIKGPGTDLRFEIGDIPVVKCDGNRNIPDGEVYTAPLRDSVQGTVRFNTPSIHDGVVYDGIELEFRDGRVVSATCAGCPDKLNAVLDTDEGARYVGEFALGVNPFINTPIRDTLFDEKIYGSFHMALGNSYEGASNGNKSGIHWDLVQIQTPDWGGGEIYFDDTLVRKDGEFVLQPLDEILNAESFRAGEA